MIPRMDTRSALFSAIAVACGVSTAICAPSFSVPREPRPTSPAATQPLRTSVPHNTANTAICCGLIASPPATSSKAPPERIWTAPDEAHCRRKCGRAQDKNCAPSPFSECVACIQLGARKAEKKLGDSNAEAASVVAAISLRRYSAISLAEARKTRKALGPPRSLH